jgi:hypothetical protein
MNLYRASVLCLAAAAAYFVVPASVPVAGQQQKLRHMHGPALAPRVGEVRGPVGGVSATPTAAFDRDGRLWVAWFEGSHVYVSSSKDEGRTFAAAVRVTREEEDVDANGEGRPKIALGKTGDIYTSWTRKGKKPFTGDIRFARSIDGGQTFNAPITVNDDGLEIGHRFDALHVGPGGTIYVAWIDKRDLHKAETVGRPYAGAALYYAVSTDRGATFAANRKLKDHVCECCRIAVAFDGDAPVLFWRDIFDGTTRDHGLVRFTGPQTPGPPRRATTDGWEINACPHHGPSIAVSNDGLYHLVWFTGQSPHGPGAFYARSTDRGQTYTTPMRIGSLETFGHADVISRGPTVYVAWKEAVQPQGMSVQLLKSSDGGRTWSAPVEALRTAGTSDHPFLIARNGDIFLSWFTAAEGLRVTNVEGRPGRKTTETASLR